VYLCIQTNGSNRSQVGATMVGVNRGDKFEEIVSLSSNRIILAVGVHRNDDNGIDFGHVRVYSFESSP